MKHILVTGASGFVGRNTTKALIEAGYKVRAQYRREKPPAELLEAARNGAELYRADLIELFEENRGEELTDGIEGIIHAAARVSFAGNRHAFKKANVDVTRGLLESAAAAGCSRFIYVSTMSVHGFGGHFYSKEEGPYYRLISNYQKSKKAAENLVAGFRDDSLKTAVLRLGFVYGPGDTKILKTVFDLLASGRMPMIGDFDVYNCLLFVEDCAQALRLALESPLNSGEILDITGNDLVTLKEAIFAAAALMGKPPPRIKVPPWAAGIAAAVLDFMYTFFHLRGEPVPSKYLVQQLSSNFHFTSEKAGKLLGFAPATDWQKGLKKAIAAYKTENPQKFR